MMKSPYLAATRIAAPLLIAMLGLGTARADIISTFGTNDEGWTVVSFGDLSVDDYSVLGTYTPTYNATGGIPGGYISVDVDPDVGQFTFAAPAAFLGNQSSALSLAYDLIHPTGAVNFQTTDVMLVGGGNRLLWQSAPPLVPSATWSHVEVSLTPSAGWLFNSTGGPVATAPQIGGVLAGLTGIYVRGEYTSGEESAGLDNFQLVPEPSTGLLVMTGLLGLARQRRRHARRAI